MKYKQIINSTQEALEKKYPWLKEADFEDAVIEDEGYDYIIWKDGVWKDGIWKDGIWKSGIWENGVWKGGVWKSGIWENGIWKGGFWKDGFWENGIWKSGVWKTGLWEGGTWEGGKMWSNFKQKYINAVQANGKFIKNKKPIK